MAAGAFLFASSAASAAVIHIRVADMAFVPAKVTAHVGDTIVWTNSDFVAHTATAKNHAFDIVLPPNAKRRLVLKKPGTFAYFCRYHPGMTAVISVAK